MDPDADPDPAIFVSDLKDASKKLIFLQKFFCLLLFEGTFTSFFKDKKSKRSHKTVGIKVFLLFFWMIEGSGSGRPKNMWIRWIRIRKTGLKFCLLV
jgi:hypothetical protein